MWIQRAKSIWHLEPCRRSSDFPWRFLSIFAYSDVPEKRAKAAPLQETRMKDRFTLYAKGGDGGSGCVSVRRSRHHRSGKPDGGNGGRGGDVILECSHTVWDFSGLQHHIRAGKGGHGAPKNKIGTRGQDKVVLVPVGTVIHLLEGEIPSKVETRSETELDPWELPGELDTNLSESDQRSAIGNPIVADDVNPSELPGKLDIDLSESDRRSAIGNLIMADEVKPICNIGNTSSHNETMVEEPSACMQQQIIQAEKEGKEEIQYNIAELTERGERIIVACGGDGGLGNVCCPSVSIKVMKSGVHRDDSGLDDKSSLVAGLPGSEAALILELKSIADVGLVGMPNAGKSTLLGVLSRAAPAVGHYAFTTLRPNLGRLNFNDFLITVADIPGLIKGAHVNRGLGHAFLRHIERTKVLAYVVDLASGLDGRKGIPPWVQLKDLILELEHHQEGLSDRPSLVVANKIDEEGAEEVYEELGRRVQGVPMYPTCAILEEGVPEVKAALKMLVNGEISQILCLENIDLD